MRIGLLFLLVGGFIFVSACTSSPSAPASAPAASPAPTVAAPKSTATPAAASAPTGGVTASGTRLCPDAGKAYKISGAQGKAQAEFLSKCIPGAVFEVCQFTPKQVADLTAAGLPPPKNASDPIKDIFISQGKVKLAEFPGKEFCKEDHAYSGYPPLNTGYRRLLTPSNPDLQPFETCSPELSTASAKEAGYPACMEGVISLVDVNVPA